MVTTIVHLMRPGEVHNPAGVLYGRLPDYHLSERGRAMADAVADYLVSRDADVVHIVASPLERAQETAAPIGAAFGLTIGTDPRLIEAGNHFQGLTFGVGDGSLRHPAHWWHLRNPFRPSWGEAYQNQAARMLAAAADARTAAEGHEAVLVSHQLPVWMARSKAEGRRLWHDPRKRECSLASLTSLVYSGDDIVEVRYAEPAAHLLPGANPTSGA